MASNEELVATIQGGDRDRLPELWTQVQRFAWQQAARAAHAYNPGLLEDYQQSAFLAFTQAVGGFRSDAGMSFIGWFAFHLKSAFAAAGGFRRREPLNEALSLDTPVSDEPEAPTIGELLPDDTAEEFSEVAARAELYAELRRAVAALPPEERVVIIARFWHGRTFNEIATSFGSSQEAVRQIEGAALRHLRHPGRNIRLWRLAGKSLCT